MIVDGTNLSTIGLIVQRRANSRGTTRINDAFATIPGANTSRRLGRGPIEPKLMTLIGFMEATSNTQLRDRLEELEWRLRPGTSHTLEWSDDSTKEWVVHFQEIRQTGVDPEWLDRDPTGVNVEINLMAEDPRGRNPTEQSVTTSGALPLVLTPSAIGNAPMPLVIEITGNNTNPILNFTLQYRDSSDAVVKSFDWDGTDLTASDTLIIDTGKATVERNGSNDISSITDDNGALPFDMDPGDGDFVAQNIPDIRLASISVGNSDNFVLKYRERYW